MEDEGTNREREDHVASLICWRFESIGKEPWRLTLKELACGCYNAKNFEAKSKIFEGKILAV